MMKITKRQMGFRNPRATAKAGTRMGLERARPMLRACRSYQEDLSTTAMSYLTMIKIPHKTVQASLCRMRIVT
jgi:hypothetical protein